MRSQRAGRTARSTRDGTPRHPTPWVAALAWLVLLVGLAASMIGALHQRDDAQDDALDAFNDTAEGVRSVVSTELAADLGLVASLQGLMAAQPHLSNPQFLSWYQASGTEQRFPGGIGLGSIDRVPAAALPAFAAEVMADPVNGLPVPESYAVFPERAVAEYCLQRVGVWTETVVQGFRVPLGFDFCAPEVTGFGPSPVPEVLAHATDTGTPGVVPPELLTESSFAVFAPVYTGPAPATVSERRAASTGWVAGSFASGTLVRSALEGTSGLSVVVVYEPPDGSSFEVARAGTAEGGDPVTLSLPLRGNPSWSVRVTGTPSIPGTSPFGQGVRSLLAGVVLTVLLFLLIHVLGSSRARALALVDRKTAELEHQALHDTLTGLPNRTLLLDRAGQMLARSRRNGTPVAALFIDIDTFKSVNDTLGHAAGDQLLTAVATRIRGALRETDVVGRLGGDEFVVLVEGEELLTGPEAVAERILFALAEPFTIDGAPLSITVSIGLALGPRDDPDDLLRDADVAMYEAKAGGRDRFIIFEPEMGAAVVDRVQLEWDLRSAVDRGQLFCQYQPTFELQSGITTGVEALVRWNHPARGLLLPDEFLPLAEDSDLIIPIGRWVLREACRQGARWSRAGLGVRVAVNVSTRQLADDHFVDDVHDALADSGFPAGQLGLEITETALMHDTTAVQVRLEALKRLGVSIAIDDFGTGYSSIAHLRQFPIDSIKIDRSFISGIAGSTEAVTLLRALVQLGRSLGLETLAEGIEEPAYLDARLREHFDQGQGFLFARPLDADTVEAFMTGVGRSSRGSSTSR